MTTEQDLPLQLKEDSDTVISFRKSELRKQTTKDGFIEAHKTLMQKWNEIFEQYFYLKNIS